MRGGGRVHLSYDRAAQLRIGERFPSARGLGRLQLEPPRHACSSSSAARTSGSAWKRRCQHCPVSALVRATRLIRCGAPSMSRPARTAARARDGVVERLAEPVRPQCAELLQRGGLPIALRGATSAASAEAYGAITRSRPSPRLSARSDAEGAVLIGVVPVAQVVRALARAPRHAVSRRTRSAAAPRRGRCRRARSRGRSASPAPASGTRTCSRSTTPAPCRRRRWWCGRGGTSAPPAPRRDRHEAREAGLGGGGRSRTDPASRSRPGSRWNRLRVWS